MTVISGNNGQGKSSIVEAFSYALSGKSFRLSPKEALVRKGETSSIVRCELKTKDRELLVEMSLSRLKSDTLLLNRNSIGRRELTHLAPMTIFTTRDVDIIAGSPDERRVFLDDALVYMGPRAAKCVENYEKLLRHRSSLLKSISYSHSHTDLDTLSIFDEALATEGEQLMRMRRSLLSKIEPILNSLYAGISGRNETVTMDYVTRSSIDLLSALKNSRLEDIKRGVTSVGPHRDDVIFTLNGLNARHEASQGEQRTLAFSLKMGLHDLIRDKFGDDPIVLLDDVFSELDQGRIDKVLEVADTAQVIVTTSSDYNFETKISQKVRIERGQLV